MSSRIPVFKFRAVEVYNALPRSAAFRFSFPSKWAQETPKKRALGPYHKPQSRLCLCSNRFLGHRSVPYILVDGFLFLLGSFCYPPGSGSAAIRRNMAQTAAASDGSPPGATNSTGRASKRGVASTPIMEEPRTELCQLERTLGIRMERIQAIAICKRRVGFGVALIACHRLPSAEWFSSQENSCKRRQGPDVSPNIERRANSPLDRLGRSFENIRSRREQLV